jgi:predicted metalloendopeptidase
MKTTLLAASALLSLTVALGCTTASAPAAEVAAPVAATPGKATLGSFGVDFSAMDTSVDPGTDFYRYVNGGWLDTFEMPADKSRYGVFDILRDQSEAQVRAIIEETAASNPASGTVEAKIAALFNAYMNEAAIEAAGLAPAKPFLDQIAAASTHADIARLFGSVGFESPVGGGVSIDSKKPDQHIFYIGQSGLGLPDRDYYITDGSNFPEARERYVALLTFVLTEAGHADPAKGAADILALETRFAQAHWDRTKSRNRDLTYNLVTREELLAVAPGFPWADMLAATGIADQPTFVLRQRDAIEALMRIAGEVPVETWQTWLTARFLLSNASVLPKRFDEASFEFYGKFLNGQPAQRERWKRAVGVVEGAVGEAVGQIYVARHFPEASKAAMDELVTNVKAAFAARLETLSWMSEETRAEARAKLTSFRTKIGYPTSFETYETLEVTDSAFGNAMAAARWGTADNLAKLGQPIDREEWGMTPQTVNAYYSPSLNEIVFPAAILQPPFFDPFADPAVNYGGIGGVIGHEIGHGFDDQGSKSDGTGLLRNWWTDTDKSAFETRTGALAAQFDAFCPLEDRCVNGRLALGENIGDLGGLSVALEAYKISLGGKDAPVLDGFTGFQRFFMGWAQVWRVYYREAALRQQLIRGPHAPGEFRVKGPLRNIDAWYAAFDVQPGDPLYLPPEERVSIW